MTSVEGMAMVPYMAQVLVEERTRRFAEEAARYRRLSERRARRRSRARLAVARALVTAGQRVAGRRARSSQPTATVPGHC